MPVEYGREFKDQIVYVTEAVNHIKEDAPNIVHAVPSGKVDKLGLTHRPEAVFREWVHISEKVADHEGEVVDIKVYHVDWDREGDVFKVGCYDLEALALMLGFEACRGLEVAISYIVYDLGVSEGRAV